jgi:hypothetical protein
LKVQTIFKAFPLSEFTTYNQLKNLVSKSYYMGLKIEVESLTEETNQNSLIDINGARFVYILSEIEGSELKLILKTINPEDTKLEEDEQVILSFNSQLISNITLDKVHSGIGNNLCYILTFNYGEVKLKVSLVTNKDLDTPKIGQIEWNWI